MNRVFSLNIFIDDQQLIRVGGRLSCLCSGIEKYTLYYCAIDIIFHSCWLGTSIRACFAPDRNYYRPVYVKHGGYWAQEI